MSPPIQPGPPPPPSNRTPRGDYVVQFRRETSDLAEFCLTDEDREKLSRMHAGRRVIHRGWVVIREMFNRLTPLRRILVVVGLVLVLLYETSVINGDTELTLRMVNINTLLGVAAILLVLMLELKDKLLAHHELQAGRAVQRAMEPPAQPDIPGWELWLFTRPANEVGGDFVDLLPLGSGTYGVALCDVSGKGLGAALLMVKLQATLRALASGSSPPASLIATTNRILIRDAVPGKFASMLFLELGERPGEIRFVNAGHMPPLIVSGSGVRELLKGDTALGLSAFTEYREDVVPLVAGEYFVVYSDGITEARNADGQFYGLERFKQLLETSASLPARDLGERVVDSVNTFVGDAKVSDDLSMVVLRHTPVSSSHRT